MTSSQQMIAMINEIADPYIKHYRTIEAMSADELQAIADRYDKMEEDANDLVLAAFNAMPNDIGQLVEATINPIVIPERGTASRRIMEAKQAAWAHVEEMIPNSGSLIDALSPAEHILTIPHLLPADLVERARKFDAQVRGA